jgi:hypothetical protein
LELKAKDDQLLFAKQQLVTQKQNAKYAQRALENERCANKENAAKQESQILSQQIKNVLKDSNSKRGKGEANSDGIPKRQNVQGLQGDKSDTCKKKGKAVSPNDPITNSDGNNYYEGARELVSRSHVFAGHFSHLTFWLVLSFVASC